jgi:hypothetical protein
MSDRQFLTSATLNLSATLHIGNTSHRQHLSIGSEQMSDRQHFSLATL